MTETNMITSNPYDGERRAGTVGFPLPGVERAHREAETGAPCRAGEIGVIEVKGPNVFKGYWRMPEKTAQEFRPTAFSSPAISAKIDARRLRPYRRPRQGPRHLRRLQCLSQRGRKRDRRDRRRARKRRDRRSARRFRRGRDRGRRPQSTARLVNEAASSRRSSGRLAKFKTPKRVFVVDELPRNAMGKVQKAALREAYKHIFR